MTDDTTIPKAHHHYEITITTVYEGDGAPSRTSKRVERLLLDSIAEALEERVIYDIENHEDVYSARYHVRSAQEERDSKPELPKVIPLTELAGLFPG